MSNRLRGVTGSLSKVLSFSEISGGMQAKVDFTITREDMRAFGEVSGDLNPVHVDGEFARAKGFKGEVAYGALIVAKISKLIGMELPGRDSVWFSLSVQFLKPLYVGERAQVEGEVVRVAAGTRLVSLKLTVRAGEGLETVVAKGKAEVQVRVAGEKAEKLTQGTDRTGEE